MNESDGPPSDDTGAADDVFDDVREAAGAVIASLKQLIEATERVVADPAAFSSAVEGGRAVVEAFVGGFTDQAAPEAADRAETPPEDAEAAPES